MVTTITGIIQGLAVVVGILGLSIWGLARIARPVFPELSSLTNQYIGSLVIGVVIGALTGAAAAYLLVQRMESEEGLEMTPGEGVKLGVSVFSFLRQVTQLGG